MLNSSLFRISLVLLGALLPDKSLSEKPQGGDACSGCNAYKCIEREKHCGANGYPESYGYKYCERFSSPEVREYFDESGKKFLQCTKPCLIRNLNDYLKKNDADCGEVETYAFENHVDCYLQCGFCDYCKTNKWAMWKSFDMKDFFNWQAVKQVLKVIWHCGPLSCFFGPSNQTKTEF